MSTTTARLPHRALIVDDNVDQREAIACFLETAGVDVSSAGDGQEALYALRTGPAPCLILLDLNMAGMDGWEFRRRQLLSGEWAGIPVVVLSGHSELKAVTQTMHAREAWRRPVEFDVLLRAVGEHCRGGH